MKKTAKRTAAPRATQCRSLPLSPVEIPPRSQLISLSPVGVGTSAVESLWGYLQRLAAAHSVRLIDLLTEFRTPLVSRSHRSRKLGFWKAQISALNNACVGYRTALFFQALTLRSDLVDLTLRKLNDVPGLQVTSRRTHAWCPSCLAEDEMPYDRLLWAIPAVTHCPRHGRKLMVHCGNCGQAPRLFRIRSSLLRCDHCGAQKHNPAFNTEPEAGGEFGLWQSRQIEKLLEEVAAVTVMPTNTEMRDRNLRISADHREIRGITGLARELKQSRSTPWGWVNDHRCMPLESASRWAWVTTTSIRQLLLTEISPQEIQFRPLPLIIKARIRRHRSVIPPNSTAIYLATLKLAGEAPFAAPTLTAIRQTSGVHEKHEGFRDVHFVRLLAALQQRSENFRHKELVWREVADVHTAAIEIVALGLPLGRRRVAVRMKAPQCLNGGRARDYLRWFKRRHSLGDMNVLRPKKIPLDVRAYWALQQQNRVA